MSFSILKSFLVGALLCAVQGPLEAQVGVVSGPPPPPAAEIRNDQRWEVETVEVRGQTAIPSQIQRKTGKFIVVITNRNLDRKEWFVIDPAPAGRAPAAASGTHLLNISAGLGKRKLRPTSLVDLPAGAYQLKYAKSGRVVCTITIG